MKEAGFEWDSYPGAKPRPTTPELRIADLDRDGLEKEIIYGCLMINDLITDGEMTRVDFNLGFYGRLRGLEAEPLPRRLVITYKHADGRPQFWAQFSEWNLAPEVPDTLFVFTPPAGAVKIAFAPQRNSFPADLLNQARAAKIKVVLAAAHDA